MLVAVTFGTMGRKSFNYHAVSQKWTLWFCFQKKYIYIQSGNFPATYLQTTTPTEEYLS